MQAPVQGPRHISALLTFLEPGFAFSTGLHQQTALSVKCSPSSAQWPVQGHVEMTHIVLGCGFAGCDGRAMAMLGVCWVWLQGREADIVILSLVRVSATAKDDTGTGGHNSLGFLTDRRWVGRR